MTTYEKKHALYRAYCKELDRYKTDGLKPMTEQEADEACEMYINAEYSKWINIYDGKELVGFLIIGKKFPEKYPGSNYSIAQAYVEPEHRRKGLMTEAVREYLQGHPGIWSLLILKGNEEADRFWTGRFKDNGFTPVYFTAPDNRLKDGVILRGFKRN